MSCSCSLKQQHTSLIEHVIKTLHSIAQRRTLKGHSRRTPMC